MSSRVVIELPRALVQVEARPGYLFIVESGQLSHMSDLKRYTARLDSMARRLKRSRAVIDARGEIGDPPPAVREAMWTWLTRPERPIQTIAFVLASEMTIARVNMTALSRKASLRAFESVQAAQRWLLRDPRMGSAATMPRIASQPPEENTEERRSGRRQRPSPGAYRMTDAPVDRLLADDDDSQVA